MLYSIKNREDLEKLKELFTLQNQVKAVRFQDKLGKQNFRTMTTKKNYKTMTTILESF